MTAAIKKTGQKKAPTAAERHGLRRRTTPDSAISLEKERLDDQAVERAITATEQPAKAPCVLPAPQLPPHEQEEVRQDRVSGRAKKPDKSDRTTVPRRTSKNV